MKKKIIIPAIACPAFAVNAKKPTLETKQGNGQDTVVTVQPDTAKQKGGLANKDSAATDLNSIGDLRLGMHHADVTKLLGEPGKKSKSTEWGADGLMHQDWDYKAKGIMLNMSDDKDPGKQEVFSITIFKPCVYKTKMNVGIGSTYQEVMAVYGKMTDKTNTDNKTITVGSVYGGIIFTFGKDDRADTVFVGAAAE